MIDGQGLLAGSLLVTQQVTYAAAETLADKLVRLKIARTLQSLCPRALTRQLSLLAVFRGFH
jgi:hypothetical protein